MDDKYLQNLVNDTVIRITKKMTGVSMQAVEAPANRSRHNPVLKILITDGGRGQVTACLLYTSSVCSLIGYSKVLTKRKIVWKQ